MFLQNNDAFKHKERRAEVKMAGFIAENNMPITIGDHTGLFLKEIVTDSNIVE